MVQYYSTGMYWPYLVWSLATFPTGMQPQVEVVMDDVCLREVYCGKPSKTQ